MPQAELSSANVVCKLCETSDESKDIQSTCRTAARNLLGHRQASETVRDMLMFRQVECLLAMLDHVLSWEAFW